VFDWVAAQVEGSLRRLKAPRLYAILLHQPQQLFGPRGHEVIKALQHAKAIGRAEKIGLSIYSADEFAPLFDEGGIDIVQAPLSLLDRRLVTSGWAGRLRLAGIELHVRSIFLQGLLLMPKAQMPEEIRRWGHIWDEWERWRKEKGLTPLAACLRYALSIPEIDKVIVGVDSVAQLQEIFAAAEGEAPGLPNWPDSVDIGLINPTLWCAL